MQSQRRNLLGQGGGLSLSVSLQFALTLALRLHFVSVARWVRVRLHPHIVHGA